MVSYIASPDVTTPPGEHHLKVEVKDSDGHLGTANVVFKVTK